MMLSTKLMVAVDKLYVPNYLLVDYAESACRCYGAVQSQVCQRGHVHPIIIGTRLERSWNALANYIR